LKIIVISQTLNGIKYFSISETLQVAHCAYQKHSGESTVEFVSKCLPAVKLYGMIWRRNKNQCRNLTVLEKIGVSIILAGIHRVFFCLEHSRWRKGKFVGHISQFTKQQSTWSLFSFAT